MLRLAILSFWHVHARDYLRDAEHHPDTEVVAAWDELPERGRAEAERRGLRFHEHLDELLARDDIDGVIVTTPTTMHLDVMVAAAEAGKHIYTEKVIATTLRETDEIVEAVARARVKLVVSLPRLYTGYTRAIQQVIGDGRLGALTEVRARVSHDGALPSERNPQGWLPPHFFDPEQAGGGALIDFGCHPMYLARRFLGMPERVSASYGYATGRPVEDNAAVLLRYADGAVGIVEAGFVNRASPFTVEVHGTEGSLLYGTPEPELKLRVGRGGEWTALDAPEDLPSAFEQWVAHIQEGTVATENIEIATDLSALMEAANHSAAEHRAVLLDSLPRGFS